MKKTRPKRVARKPDRLGKRLSTVNHDEFFVELSSESGSPSHETISQEIHQTTTEIQSTPNSEQICEINDSMDSIAMNGNSIVSISSIATTNISIDSSDIIATSSIQTGSSDSIATSSISAMLSDANKSIGENSFEQKVLTYLKEILARSIETEKHVARLDARLLNHNSSDHHSIDRQENYVCQQIDSNDQTELIKFGLPISSLVNMKKIEANLKNDEFFDKVTRILQKIGGVDGKGNGVKMLEPLIHAIIEPKMLANISWTGRGKGNEKKIPMSAHVNIVRLITSLCEKADSSYLPKDCQRDIVYKILKHAVTKFGSTNHDEAMIIS